jgi:hypothetical protein
LIALLRHRRDRLLPYCRLSVTRTPPRPTCTNFLTHTRPTPLATPAPSCRSPLSAEFSTAVHRKPTGACGQSPLECAQRTEILAYYHPDSRRPSWTDPMAPSSTSWRLTSSSCLNFSSRRPSLASVHPRPRVGHDELGVAWPACCPPHLIRSSCSTRCRLLKDSQRQRGLIDLIDVVLFLSQSLLYLGIAATGRASDRSWRESAQSLLFFVLATAAGSDRSGCGYFTYMMSVWITFQMESASVCGVNLPWLVEDSI